MEKHVPSQSDTTPFITGSSVIYAMHGKCSVLGIEVRLQNGNPIEFYKLEVKKSAFSRSNRNDPAIWVPVLHARERGLRAPMNKEEAENAVKILGSREYFFKLTEPWHLVSSLLESTVRLEGGVGLAKAASFLFVLRRKQVVPSSEVIKLQENVNRLLFRELSEALNEPLRILEEKINKSIRVKLIPDS
jgi:RNA polymerase-interacting CarD/CdnL/TRCF family regulator